MAFIENRQIRVGKNGEKIFFPWGPLGNAYILSITAEKSAVRLIRIFVLSFVVLLVLKSFLPLFARVLGPLPVVIYIYCARRIVSGLTQSRDQDLRQEIRQEGRNIKHFGLICFAIMAIYLIISCHLLGT